MIRSEELAAGLARWRQHSDDVTSLVIRAEALSDLPSHSRAMLDQVGSDGVTLAQAVREAARQIRNYRTPQLFQPSMALTPGQFTSVSWLTQLTANDRERGAEAIERIRDAQAADAVVNPQDMTLLRELFYQNIIDPNVAAAALDLALMGYPMAEALVLYTQNDVAAVYDQVLSAALVGQTPAQAGLAPGLFPPRILKLNATSFAGTLTHLYVAQEIADWAGPTSSNWLGSALVPVFETGKESDIVAVGQIVKANLLVAVGFMNELGASGVAALPAELERHGLLDSSLADYATALGLASLGPLAFGGAELIDAGTVLDAPEQLLFAPQYDQDFLVQAIVASFVDRGSDPAAWSDIPRSDLPLVTDPRSIAARAAVNAGLSSHFVYELVEHHQLSMLIEPPVPFANDQAVLAGQPENSPFTVLLAEIGDDRRASLEVVEYLYGRGAYGLVPLGNGFGEGIRETLNEHRRLDDERVATGLSVMLTRAAAGFIAATANNRGVDEYVETQLESPYFAAYHTVLVSESGAHLGYHSEGILYQIISDHLAVGGTTLGAHPAVAFLGVADGLRHHTHLGNAELVDAAADDLALSLSLVGLVAGFADGKAGNLASLGLTLGSYGVASDNTALDVSTGQLDEVLHRSAEVHRAALIALFGSGMVQTATGAVISLVPAGGGYKIVDEDDNEISLDGTNGGPYDLDDLPPGYIASEELADLQVNEVPLSQLLASIETLDAALDRAERSTHEQLGD